MEHQDWKPVVFKKKIVKKESVVKQKVSSEASHKNRKLDEETENFKIERVDLSVRQAIMKGRNARKMKQKDLANLLALRSDIIINYENGKAVPNQRVLQKMERVLGIKLTGKNIGEWLPGKEPETT